MPSLETVTLKSSSDSERPLGVVSGSSISNFILNWRVDCSLFGGIGLPCLRQLPGNRYLQHISYRGLSIGVRRERWFLICP